MTPSEQAVAEAACLAEHGPAHRSLVYMAALAAGVVIGLAASHSGYPATLALGHLGWLLAIAWQDVRTHRVPNRLVYAALAFGSAASIMAGWDAARDSFQGAAAAALVLLAIFVAGRGAMGFGDVKVGCLCGMAAGIQGVLPMLALTFIAGGLLGAVLLLFRLRSRKDTIAFTPFLAAATVVWLAQGQAHW